MLLHVVVVTSSDIDAFYERVFTDITELSGHYTEAINIVQECEGKLICVKVKCVLRYKPYFIIILISVLGLRIPGQNVPLPVNGPYNYKNNHTGIA